MTIPTDIGAAPRVREPVVMVRAQNNTTSIDVRLGDSAATVTAATYALYNGTTVLQQTVLGDLAPPSTTVSASSIPSTLSYGEGYREVWTLTIAGTATVFTRPVILAKYPYHCPITQADLTAEYPDLNDALRSADASSLQPFIDAAHADIIRRMSADALLASTLVDQHASFTATRELALHKVFRAYSLALDEKSSYARLADRHLANYERAYLTMRSRVDLDQDGAADSETRSAVVTKIGRGSAPVGDGWYGSRRRVI